MKQMIQIMGFEGENAEQNMSKTAKKIGKIYKQTEN